MSSLKACLTPIYHTAVYTPFKKDCIVQLQTGIMAAITFSLSWYEVTAWYYKVFYMACVLKQTWLTNSVYCCACQIMLHCTAAKLEPGTTFAVVLLKSSNPFFRFVRQSYYWFEWAPKCVSYSNFWCLIICSLPLSFCFSVCLLLPFSLHLSAGGVAIWTRCLCGWVLVGRTRTSGASSRAGYKCGRGGKSN